MEQLQQRALQLYQKVCLIINFSSTDVLCRYARGGYNK